MEICLAPMEGVIDHQMRGLLTKIGGYHRCVTEFIRVTEHAIPARVLFRYCPELRQGGYTDSSVPVYVQLLGGNPELLAKSARVAEKLGAPGIDLNFGCPAKVVNRHDGGSVLLKEPHRIYDIVSATRDRVKNAPVTAKIRLGFDHPDYLDELIDAVDRAGADELCIHARTRRNGYRPPAHWHLVGDVTHPSHTKIIINGEIWNPQHAATAIAQSRCGNLMIGRGGLACPDLARQIKSYSSESEKSYTALTWNDTVLLVEEFFHRCDCNSPRYTGNRTKQWLAYLKRHYLEASELFESIKRLRDFEGISAKIRSHVISLKNMEAVLISNEIPGRPSDRLLINALPQ